MGRPNAAEELALDPLTDLNEVMNADADQAEGPPVGFPNQQGFGSLEQLFG